jgi:hypothetical protein
MRAEGAWQHWADALLSRLGRQPEGGKLGDEPAREAIGAEVERLRGALGDAAEEFGRLTHAWSEGDSRKDLARELYRRFRTLADTREPKP